MNVPGTGHHPIREAILSSLDEATERVDIVNPYIANPGVIHRFLTAAQQGVAVRVVVPAEPRPPYPLAAFRAWYPQLLDAGVTILRHPGMAHAKVYRFDDRLLVGSCNLDNQSLYRNDELDLRFEGARGARSGRAVLRGARRGLDARHRVRAPPQPRVGAPDGEVLADPVAVVAGAGTPGEARVDAIA